MSPLPLTLFWFALPWLSAPPALLQQRRRQRRRQSCWQRGTFMLSLRCCRDAALCTASIFLFVFLLLRFIFLPLSLFIFSFVLFLHFVHGSKQESVRERLVPSPAWWACKNRRTRPLAFPPNLRATAAAALHNKRRHSRTRAPARSLVSLLAPLSASRAYSESSLAPLGNNSAPQCKKIKRRKRRKKGATFGNCGNGHPDSPSLIPSGSSDVWMLERRGDVV